MEIFALFMVCGIFTTLLIPETKRRTLEDLAKTYHSDHHLSGIETPDPEPESEAQ